MNIKPFIFFAFSSLFGCCLLGQDLHSSNYDYNQVYLNPAEAGSFLGTYRIMGSYRDQYDAFIAEGYNRQIAAVDMPINIRFIKKGWTGYGLGLYNDKAGDLGVRSTGITASLSYHIPIDRRKRNTLGFGLQVSRIQRGINNPDEAKFGDVLAGGGGNDFGLLDQFSINSTDYNVGILYKSLINKRTKMELGGSVRHLISGNISTNKLFRRFNAYAKVPYLATKKFIVEPRVFMSFASNNYDINIQTIARYNMNPTLTLSGGLGYRVADALQALLSINYKGWDVGFSYDATLSGARSYNNGQGGFEIGLKKIVVLPANITIEKVKICPRN